MSEHEVGQAYFGSGECDGETNERMYRYALSRVWDVKLPMLLFVGLNPSTADENLLDPTLRRVISFAKREGCGGIWVGNLFAFRATKPSNMKKADDPVGPDNDRWLMDMAKWCSSHILVGWGTHGGFLGRDMEVRRLLQGYTLKCLAVTGGGFPGHPLYIKGDAPLQVFQNHMWRPGG